jgi:hypothetical protein
MKTEFDKILKEIRESRNRMSEKSGHNLVKFIDHLKSFNDKYSTQVKSYKNLKHLELKNNSSKL